MMLLLRNKTGLPYLGHADGLLRAPDRALPASQAFICDHCCNLIVRNSDGTKQAAFLTGPAAAANINIYLGAIAAGVADRQAVGNEQCE